MADKTVTARKIKIENKLTGEPCPLINGSNFFSGEFRGMEGTFGLTATDQESWEKMWETIGEKPPGKLPSDALAVLQAVKVSKSAEALAFEPSRIAMIAAEMANGKHNISIDWNRLHTDYAEDMMAHPRYAVLLLPDKGNLKASFNDIWPLREQRAMEGAFKDSLKLFNDGIVSPKKNTLSVTFHKDNARKMNLETPLHAKKMSKHSSKGPPIRKPRVKGRGSMQMKKA